MNEVFQTINELTLSGLKRKQASITQLWPPFYDRVKKIGSMGGIRLEHLDTTSWKFRVHSGTDADKWYENYIEFVNIPYNLKHLVSDKRLWTKDKKRVNLTSLAKAFLFSADIRWDCSCPAQHWWGLSYILSKPGVDAKFGDPQGIRPKVRNPKEHGAVCKHLQNLMNVLPMYLSDIAKWLRETYGKEIAKYFAEAQAELAGFRSAAEFFFFL